MSSITRDVDQDILGRMKSWGEDITDFEAHHAADGLYIANSAVRGARGTDDIVLGALNTAFTFWIDDRSDKHLHSDASPVSWDDLLAFTDGASAGASAPTASPELRALTRLGALMEQRASSRADYLFWRTSVGKVLRGMRFEEQVSRGTRPVSYAEYLEAGAASIAIWAVMAGLYIVNDIERTARHGDPWLEGLERYLGMSQRLTNDLFSAEKERRESRNQHVCNSVLLLERFMASPRQARSFVEEQKAGYDSLVAESLSMLGDADPVVQMTRPMLACIDEWYSKAPVRYGTE